MGLEFAKANPAGGGADHVPLAPDLQKTLKPQLALESMIELAHAYGDGAAEGRAGATTTRSAGRTT